MRSRCSFVVLVGVIACNAPPKDPPRDGAESAQVSAPVSGASAPAPLVSASGAPSASASSRPVVVAKPGTCASDADCHTFSSYCSEAPCACRAIANADGDPKCLGTTKVQCFADPCMKKVAGCQAGVCVLTGR